MSHYITRTQTVRGRALSSATPTWGTSALADTITVNSYLPHYRPELSDLDPVAPNLRAGGDDDVYADLEVIGGRQRGASAVHGSIHDTEYDEPMKVLVAGGYDSVRDIASFFTALGGFSSDSERSSDERSSDERSSGEQSSTDDSSASASTDSESELVETTSGISRGLAVAALFVGADAPADANAHAGTDAVATTLALDAANTDISTLLTADAIEDAEAATLAPLHKRPARESINMQTDSVPALVDHALSTDNIITLEHDPEYAPAPEDIILDNIAVPGE